MCASSTTAGAATPSTWSPVPRNGRAAARPWADPGGLENGPLRLDPIDVPYLPLPAAMLDRTGHPVAQTPEWRGAGPGSLTYHAGQAQLVIGPTEAVPTGQQ